MRTFRWWLKQKRRVQKKYNLLCCWYYSPKETREWYKNWIKQKKEYEKRHKREKAIKEWLSIHCPKCANNDDRGTQFVNCQAEYETLKHFGIACIHYERYVAESDIEKRKPCINYSDGCKEWAGCPCVHYKTESEELYDT